MYPFALVTLKRLTQTSEAELCYLALSQSNYVNGAQVHFLMTRE